MNVINEIKIKKNRIFLNNKILPTNFNGLTGEIIENTEEYIILNVDKFKIFTIANSKLKYVTPKKEYKKIKIYKPIKGLFLELTKGSFVEIQTLISKNEHILTEETVLYTKILLLQIKKNERERNEK